MEATLLPKDSFEALGCQEVPRCENRGLMLSRFANPKNRDDNRRAFLSNALKIPVASCKRESWNAFLLNLVTPENIHFGKLQSRLLINMAGGVMENAGISLDRLSGLPYIPGSALKGCARKAALLELKEAESSRKAGLLSELALVFGWTSMEWEEKGDFVWACGDSEAEIRSRAAEILAEKLSIPIRGGARPWEKLPVHAGAVSFLPAFPWGLSSLELDVLTSHHQKYYAGDKPVATDDENPNPVIFPAVAEGTIFAFAILGRDPHRTAAARQWLKTALEVHGIGAKTAAGYGWFEDVSPCEVEKIQYSRQIREAEEARKREERARKAAEEEARLRREQEAQRFASMMPEEREDAKIGALNDDQFRSKLQGFENLESDEQAAIVRALLGPRSAAWEKVKQLAMKKKKPWTHLNHLLPQMAKKIGGKLS